MALINRTESPDLRSASEFQYHRLALSVGDSLPKYRRPTTGDRSERRERQSLCCRDRNITAYLFLVY